MAEKGKGLSLFLATHLSRVWALAPIDLSLCPLTLLHIGDSCPFIYSLITPSPDPGYLSWPPVSDLQTAHPVEADAPPGVAVQAGLHGVPRPLQAGPLLRSDAPKELLVLPQPGSRYISCDHLMVTCDLWPHRGGQTGLGEVNVGPLLPEAGQVSVWLLRVHSLQLCLGECYLVSAARAVMRTHNQEMLLAQSSEGSLSWLLVTYESSGAVVTLCGNTALCVMTLPSLWSWWITPALHIMEPKYEAQLLSSPYWEKMFTNWLWSETMGSQGPDEPLAWPGAGACVPLIAPGSL